MTEIAQVAWEYGGEFMTSTTCWLNPGIELVLVLGLVWLFAELEHPAKATAAAVTPITATEILPLRAIPSAFRSTGQWVEPYWLPGAPPPSAGKMASGPLRPTDSGRVPPIRGTSATEKMTAASSSGHSTSNLSR